MNTIFRSGEAKPRFLCQRLHFSTRTLDRTTSAHAHLCTRYAERISAPRRYYDDDDEILMTCWGA